MNTFINPYKGNLGVKCYFSFFYPSLKTLEADFLESGNTVAFLKQTKHLLAQPMARVWGKNTS